MFLAEIGDKTFILTMVSYQELGACITFITAYVTLSAMHILASTLGWGVAFVIPEFWTKLVATIIFIVVAIGMFIMAFYDRHPNDTNKMLGKDGHSVTVTVKETVKVDQKEGGDSDSDSGSGSGGSDSDGSGSGSGSGDSDSEKAASEKKSSSSSESDSESDEEDSEDEQTAGVGHLEKEELPSQMLRVRSASKRVVPVPKALRTTQQTQDKNGIFAHHHEEY